MKKHLFLKTLLVLVGVLVTSLTTQSFAYNEYNKKYLYVNATNCSWWTDYADAVPVINGYDDYACNTEKFWMGSPTGTTETKVWYFDLSTSGYGSYMYTRGFRLQRYSASQNKYDNEYKIGVVDGQTHNCIWKGNDGAGCSWGYYAVPITSIALAGSNNILSGAGTSENPYRVLVGNEITLTATPTFTPADETMKFCANFGVNPAENPTTEQNSSTYTVNSTDKVELKCVGRNKYGDVYSADVTSSSVWVQGVTSYTLTYSVGTVEGTDGDISTSPETASGSTVQSGNSVTLTAPAAKDGFTWKGWYTNAAGTEGKIDDTNRAITVEMDDDKELYACYTENLCTVTITANDKSKGSITVAGEAFAWDGTVNVGVATTKALVVTPVAGYYFSGWTLSTDPDFAVGNATEDGASTTLSGLGGTDGSTGTLTANFAELDKVYFRNWNDDSNAALWENVYVYFSISYEDGCAKSNSSTDFYTAMTQDGSTNIYWAYVPRATTRYSNDDIAFSNHDFGANYKFYDYEAAMRGDYRSNLSLFVPRHASTYEKNSTTYYNGYWKHHNLAQGANSGYSIERYNGSSYEAPADNGGDPRKFIVVDENTIQYTLNVTNLSDDYNRYMIYSDGEIHYITYNTSAEEAGYTITSSNNDAVHMTEYNSGSPRFEIEPTITGYYTLTIDMSSDEMKLSVAYPATYAVNFNAPTNGTLTIKKGETPITSGDTFVAGTELTVEATPISESYELDEIVVQNEFETDVTKDVLSGTTLTVPAYIVTVIATFKASGGGTAVDNTAVSKKAVKRIVNGQLVIEREGKLYNALGAEVK